MTIEVLLGLSTLALLVLLTVGVPRRWLIRVMLLWLVSPVIVYFAVILWETATRPGTETSLSNALLGLSLISAIVLIPWLIFSAVGFAVGLGLRKIVRGKADTAPITRQPLQPVNQPAPPRPAAQTTNIGRAFARPIQAEHADVVDWRSTHIGFSGDDLRIDRVDIWKEKWRPTGLPSVRLPHPAYPAQMHDYDIYECGDPKRSVRFAVDELSNGVYGFYTPSEHPVQSHGMSASGVLRFEERLGDYIGPGRYDSLTSWVVLIDAETGEVLADGSSWIGSTISSNPDGSLSLKLRQDSYDVIFVIDPDGRSFVNQDDPSVRRPISNLVDAIYEAREEAKGAKAYRHISPDAAIRVDVQSTEWGNSQWVHSPRVIEIATGRIVLDLWGSDWDAGVSFPDAGQVTLSLRRYHFGGGMTVILDLPHDSYRITQEDGIDPGQSSGPLDLLAAALELSCRRSGAAIAAQQGSEDRYRAFDHKSGPFAAWRMALLILAGAAAALGGIAFVAYQTQPQKKAFVPTPIPRPILSTEWHSPHLVLTQVSISAQQLAIGSFQAMSYPEAYA